MRCFTGEYAARSLGTRRAVHRRDRPRIRVRWPLALDSDEQVIDQAPPAGAGSPGSYTRRPATTSSTSSTTLCESSTRTVTASGPSSRTASRSDPARSRGDGLDSGVRRLAFGDDCGRGPLVRRLKACQKRLHSLRMLAGDHRQPIRERRRHPRPFIPVTNLLERTFGETRLRTRLSAGSLASVRAQAHLGCAGPCEPWLAQARLHAGGDPAAPGPAPRAVHPHIAEPPPTPSGPPHNMPTWSRARFFPTTRGARPPPWWRLATPLGASSYP
jgi:hypothetical protein